ncbi:6-pyruvoyl-tetrahydropterin synthase (fragment) [Desulfosarcina cetonica]
MGRIGKKMFRGPRFHNGTGIHEDHTIGDFAGKSHFVSHADHGHALAGQGLHDIQYLADHLRIQGRGGFVEKHHLGIHGQRAGNGHALLLPARELVRKDIDLVADADFLQQRHGFFRGCTAGTFAHDLLGQGHVFQNRFVRKKVKGLKHHAHLGTDLVDVGSRVEDIDAIDINMPAGGVLQPVETAQKCAFSGAGGADHHNDFTGGDIGGDIHKGVDRMGRIEGFIYIFCLYHDVAILLSRYCTYMERLKVSTR